jgi:hypothetical protein
MPLSPLESIAGHAESSGRSRKSPYETLSATVTGQTGIAAHMLAVESLPELAVGDTFHSENVTGKDLIWKGFQHSEFDGTVHDCRAGAHWGGSVECVTGYTGGGGPSGPSGELGRTVDCCRRAHR